MKRVKYSDDNLLKAIRNLKPKEKFLLEWNGKKKIGIECITSFSREFIFIGLYDDIDEYEFFPRPVFGGEISYEEDIEADILEYIDELLENEEAEYGSLYIDNN